MKTALWDRHVALGAKMVNFAGWEMPLQYKGVLHEHKQVREQAGLFDVSHMARVAVKGPQALSFFEWIATNTLRGPHTATYTCFCNAEGGTVDDALVYRESDTSLFVIFNASRREADLKHFYEQAKPFDIQIEECFHNEGILALQGPHSPLTQAPMTFERRGDLIVAGTGYTGSGGVEIFGPNHAIIALWDELIASGIEPIGLAARDTLRLEKGYALYGHELSETISPTESVSAWTVKNPRPFLGKSHLKHDRHAYGVKITDSPIPREGCPVFAGPDKIGLVTSGGFSPTLKCPLALILTTVPLTIPLTPGDPVTLEIRGRQVPGTIASLPFVCN